MVVLITGGSSGLGESITRRFAKDPICTIYFTFNQSENNAKKIESECPNTTAVKCDFANENDVKKLAEHIAVINPSVFINNAYSGSFMKSHFHKTHAGDFLTEFKNNIIPVIILTQAAINCFRKKKSGKIITVLTAALVNVPPAGASIYVANKAYLAQLSKVWAAENSKYNITSNTVSPSFMKTNFTNDIDVRIVEQIKEGHPLKRLLATEETAETIFFLANASDHLNGIDIVINSAINIK